jgi:hypothetical protein
VTYRKPLIVGDMWGRSGPVAGEGGEGGEGGLDVAHEKPRSGLA